EIDKSIQRIIDIKKKIQEKTKDKNLQQELKKEAEKMINNLCVLILQEVTKTLKLLPHHYATK
ncbi:MAG: hypothetical protein Q4Q06_04730, partial [Bacteroidota bacterium]|nr:hypothetical protein [Bacteroidota bacterium]